MCKKTNPAFSSFFLTFIFLCHIKLQIKKSKKYIFLFIFFSEKKFSCIIRCFSGLDVIFLQIVFSVLFLFWCSNLTQDHFFALSISLYLSFPRAFVTLDKLSSCNLAIVMLFRGCNKMSSENSNQDVVFTELKSTFYCISWAFSSINASLLLW